jgi:50S ribosomal protein L16 3-hydroxylase
MDDVMVSYATDGAGVGPHFDQYDVFLLQGAGKRHWKVGPRCDHTTPVIESGGLKLIEEFESSQTYVLEPGDVLYVPPGFAHWGSAVGESMTFSLGFRATQMTDLVARLSDNVIESLREDLLLEDLDSLCEQSRPGEITPQQIQNAQGAVVNAIDALASEDWFPELLSEAPVEPIPQALPRRDRVILSTHQRLLWRDAGDALIAYLGGEAQRLEPVDEHWLATLCSGRSLSTASLDTRQHDILAKWWLLGFVEEPELAVAH